MKAIRTSAALLLLATTACFHQIVHTGRTAGSTVIEKPWTSTWILGLVPAEIINTAAQCPSGVATVETQRSFANGLVGIVTLGIYTPVDVKITCASGSAMLPGAVRIDVAPDASLAQREAALNAAIDLSTRNGSAVVVRF